MEAETMKKGKAIIEKCLEELFEKGDLTPAETKTAKDAMELRELLMCEIANCRATEDMTYSQHGYSGYNKPFRRYEITSYGHSNPMRTNGYSGDYGVEDWYRSNNNRSYCGSDWHMPDYSERRYGYSRHSIGDRVVATLEKMMDRTESEYEKEELYKFIRMVREAAD